jgi:hypothetical protein
VCATGGHGIVRACALVRPHMQCRRGRVCAPGPGGHDAYHCRYAPYLFSVQQCEWDAQTVIFSVPVVRLTQVINQSVKQQNQAISLRVGQGYKLDPYEYLGQD